MENTYKRQDGLLIHSFIISLSTVITAIDTIDWLLVMLVHHVTRFARFLFTIYHEATTTRKSVIIGNKTCTVRLIGYYDSYHHNKKHIVSLERCFSQLTKESC